MKLLLGLYVCMHAFQISKVRKRKSGGYGEKRERDTEIPNKSTSYDSDGKWYSK